MVNILVEISDDRILYLYYHFVYGITLCIANNIYYGGRVIFEWKNEQQVLNVYPENLTTTIVITEPAYGSGNIQQVLLPNGQMGYVQQQTSVPVMATAAYAPPQAQPPVIVVNGDANNPMQQKDSNGSNAV